MLRTIFGKKEETQSSSSTMAATITQQEFKEALGRYPEVLKTHGKTPKDAATTIEELDKFRYQIAPMNFSKNTGRIMELSDVEKLVQWKIHHGAFRATLPKLVASNTNEIVADATKDAFAAYAENNKDIATVISKLSTPLKGIGPATASLLLAIHDPQNVVFFSDELFSYLTADGKKVDPKYTTKEFETMFAEAQTVMSRLNCTPIELEKVAYVLIKEKVPEKAGRPALPEGEKKVNTYVPSGKPRGRPAMTEAEKKAKLSRREAEKTKAAKSVTNRTRTGRVVKPRDLLVAQVSDVKKTQVKKRGRPAAKVASDAKPATKKRGRPAGKAEGSETKAKAPATKKAGRPATKVEKVAAPAKKRGRPAADVGEGAPATKKRGRPAKIDTAVEDVKTPKKRGRSVTAEATTATSASKKHGRPSKADTEVETKTPASKKKTTATPTPASSAKRSV
ncbi:hypothetical protein BKA65DRAFT_513881 [Rhexocercosporidium sp. MPI-PUGE-AT-0058]|nr:hypothetical protein BKA65DRAFT_513881 [Rhexocercosporidium sp. MPI-PUGE-AT-0058]